MDDVKTIIYRYLYDDVLKHLRRATKDIEGDCCVAKCDTCEKWTQNDKCYPFNNNQCWDCCNDWIDGKWR